MDVGERTELNAKLYCVDRVALLYVAAHPRLDPGVGRRVRPHCRPEFRAQNLLGRGPRKASGAPVPRAAFVSSSCGH